jgi:hypothetical protein
MASREEVMTPQQFDILMLRLPPDVVEERQLERERVQAESDRVLREIMDSWVTKREVHEAKPKGFWSSLWPF